MPTKRIQLELALGTWGGKRAGAGRPQVNRRCSEPHRVREPFSRRSATHVTLRIVDGLPTLRCPGGYAAFHTAMTAVHARDDFRIVHASIQRNHLHLVNEASDRMALARGIQALEISAAHHLKKHMQRDFGVTRAGAIFAVRYHVEIVDTPTQARNALAYVLLNWRKHGEDRDPGARTWLIDPYSSALAFTGWSDAHARWATPDGYRPLPTREPATWLLRTGWAKGGSISMVACPAPASSHRRG